MHPTLHHLPLFKLDYIVKPAIQVLPLYKDMYSHSDILPNIEAEVASLCAGHEEQQRTTQDVDEA
ncbi:hypothetical protein EDD15DRAFT_2366023 [Pisolithus albus]|nr:hypothetical protein EDD15DRAFT_2375836 [Pisolithus albus]KAI5995109.1 hypothetical protein EDD15DRAFT_2366023 [Pisolithus albus]